MERARLREGSLLVLRTGRGVWHADALGADEIQQGLAGTEFRIVLFWVNLARKDKQVEPSALVVEPQQIPMRKEGDAMVRALVGEGSPARLGTPALVLDIELPRGGEATTSVPPQFQRFAYVLGARPLSEPIGAGRSPHSLSFWVPVRRSQSEM